MRGRSSDGIVSDKESRKRLYEEIDEDIKKMPAAKFSDTQAVEVKLVAYLHAKLKDL